MMYHRRKRERSLRQGLEVSEYYNNHDAFDEDANPSNPSIDEMLSPHSSWSNSSSKSSKSLGDIASNSAQNHDSGQIVNYAPSTLWNKKKTSMSKLAAGATQHEFAQNG